MNATISLGLRTAVAFSLLAAPLAFAQQPNQPTAPPAGQNAPPARYDRGGMHGQRPEGGSGDHRQNGEARRGDGLEGDAQQDMYGTDDEMSDLDFNAMELPPDDWWKRPGLAALLSLTPDQTKRLDDLYLQSRLTEIQMHAMLDEQELRLEPILSAPTVDQAKAQAALDKLAETRAALEKAQGKIMLNMRAVLTADQWTKLHDRRATYGRGYGGAMRNGPQQPQAQ